MNNQILRIAAHGHDFFLRYPNAVVQLDLVVAGRNVPDTFHYVHELLAKEQSEHLAAAQTESLTHKNVTALSKSLRHMASSLTRSINAVLDLLDRSAEELFFTSGVDLVSNLEAFAAALVKVQDILDANPTLKTAHTQFLTDLAAYKAASSQIGATKTTADVEKNQFFTAVETYEPVIAALHSLIQRYLAATDPVLLAEYKKGLAYGAHTAAKAAAGAGAASNVAVEGA